MAEPRKRVRKTAANGEKCGAKNRQGEPCARPAGWGTDHVGVGRCKMHGGKSPIKSGRYSRYPRERLADVMERLDADPDPLDTTEDLLLIRACALHAFQKHGAIPLVAELSERAARVAEIAHKRTRAKTISLETLQRCLEQLGASVAKHVRDPEALRAIEREWAELRID